MDCGVYVTSQVTSVCERPWTSPVAVALLQLTLGAVAWAGEVAFSQDSLDGCLAGEGCMAGKAWKQPYQRLSSSTPRIKALEWAEIFILVFSKIFP